MVIKELYPQFNSVESSEHLFLPLSGDPIENTDIYIASIWAPLSFNLNWYGDGGDCQGGEEEEIQIHMSDYSTHQCPVATLPLLAGSSSE